MHVNVTAHPTSLWTIQQLREAIPSDHAYRWLIHDRSSIFSENVDRAIRSLGIEALKAPVRAPQANAYCERLIGSLRRECLDWFLVLNERHLRIVVRDWAAHYNHGRPHRSLGPGIPDPPTGLLVRAQMQRHQLPRDNLIKKKARPRRIASRISSGRGCGVSPTSLLRSTTSFVETLQYPVT